MRKRLLFLAVSVLIGPVSSLAVLFIGMGVAHADPTYNSSYLISDKLFTDYGSMSASDIQSFLNSENSGLKNYSDTESCSPPTPTQPYAFTYYQHCNTTQSAAQIIFDAAQAYQISPRVIMATLQKEQSLITTPNPTQSAINCAMGYNSCSGFVGFFSQVDNGTWDFRRFIELMNNRNWWGKAPSQYPCLISNAGTSNYNRDLLPGNIVTFADPGGNARTITLQTSATAALYCYTPFVGPISDTGYSGSYNFVVSFEQWWGSVSSPCYNDNNLATTTGESVIPNKYLFNGVDYLTLILPNNTGSACVEAHVWNTGEQSWMTHVATQLMVFDPATSRVITGDLNGDGQDDLVLVKYLNTGSGKIEIHEWDPTYQKWLAHVATNLPSTDPSVGQVITLHMPGEKFTRFAYIKYLNTGSGYIEVHIWNTSQTGFINDFVTNLPATDTNTGQVIATNPFGEAYDRLAYVKYQNTGSGMVEVHIWNLGFQSFINDFATNLPSVSPNIGQVISGNIYGEGHDRLMFVKYTLTGSGMVEVHVWNPGLTTWYTHIATNLSQF